MRGTDRHDRPAPRVVRDRPQPAADVDDPPPADRPDHRPASSWPASSASARCRPSSRVQVLAQRPEWACVHAGRAGRGVRGPAVPRVLPADAGLHPALDRDVLDHRREAGADAGAGARRRRSGPWSCSPARPSPRSCPGVAGGLGHVRRVRRARVARLRPGAVRRRHRFELAGRGLRARAGGRAVVGRGRASSSARGSTIRGSRSRSAASSSCRSSR